MYVLGIESSCDETSAAVVRDGKLLSNIISSQFFHAQYGGIVPELASRAHLQAIIPIVDAALQEASITASEIDLCSVTQGPGLIGSLLVGLNFAKGFSLAHSIPLLPVHHIEAHIFSTFLEEDHPTFPFLTLVVSGGHTLIVLVKAVGEYVQLGTTHDDAAGEAFDKVAKMLGLGFPGGPAIDMRAKLGDPKAISFPRSMIDSASYDFSFSGIKTSVLYFLRKQFKENAGNEKLTEEMINNVAAGFQAAVVDVLVSKIFRAASEHSIQDLAVVGGVSANSALSFAMRQRASVENRRVFIPQPVYSTDNAAMIALLGYQKAQAGNKPSTRFSAFARSQHFSIA